MALNISSSQIYAGRYHYKRPEIPNLLDTQKYTASTPGKSVKEATGVDTVTISDEGLAKAKDWREYTKDNENISHTGVNPKEELYKELNTVNNIDTASMFNCELGEVADQIQKENGLGDHSRSQEEFLTVMAKAYQVIYDRIDEEFSDPDRDPTWIRQEDGTLVEETKQDRIDALNKAYNSRAEFAAASAKVMAEIDETFHGGNYGEGFIDELQKKVMESWHNAVDEKNMQRQKVSSFQDYPVDLGIGADWSAKIMAVKVGNSWVSETALTYAKAKSGSGTSVSLKALSDRYPGVNFTTNTQNFSQKGTNNIQIAPNILVQMQNDPDKRVEYEALIYDCAQLVYSGKMSQGGMGYHIKAAGTVINADGSVSGWSIAEDDDGGQTRNSTKLDKDKKDTWADKIHEKQKAKSEKARKEAAARLQEQMNGTEMKSYADNLFLSQAGMDSYNQLSSVSYQDYVNRFESEVSEVYEKDGNADAVKSDSFDQHVNRMAAAYDKMKNSIEEKYAKEDHKTEYHHFSMTR